MTVRRFAWASLLGWSARIAAGLVALFLVAFSAVHLSAASVNVDTNSDTTDPCAITGVSPCSLRDAVSFANANDSTTITFNAGLPSPITLTQGTTLALTRTTGTGTTITGPGAGALTVDGNCTTNMGGQCTAGGVTVFTISVSVTVSISGLTVQHGNTNFYGGGVINGGSLSLSNVAIRANHATSGGGIYNQLSGSLTTGANTVIGGPTAADGNSTSSFGGGVYNVGAWNAQTGLTVSNNVAGGDGGGIHNDSGTNTVTLTAPTISNNQTPFAGGGITNASGSTVTITGGSIASNQVTAASTGGGGVYNIGTLTLNAVTVRANTVTLPSLGGGIYNTGSLTTGASTVIGGPQPTDANTAYYGGGVYDTGAWSAPAGLTISNNTANQAGGGVYLASSSNAVTLTNPTISANQASFAGGGVYSDSGSSNVTLSGATITGNQVTNGSGGGGGGGISANGTMTLDNCTIGGTTGSTANTTTNGSGGGVFAGGTLTIRNGTTILGNTAGGNGGGIVVIGGATATITDSTIGGASANVSTNGNGGGIAAGSAVHLSGSTVIGNTANNGSGGGIYSTAGTLTLDTGSKVTNNMASADGGISKSAGQLTIDATTISNNTASSFAAGGFSVPTGVTATVTNSTISGNTVSAAGQFGGGILNDGGTLTVTNSTISDNTAPLGGALGNTNAGVTTLTHVTVSANHTGIKNDSNLTLKNSIVANTIGGVNCTGTITDGHYNLDSGTSCSLSDPTDITNTDPQLLALGNYGGPTQTLFPKVSSPVINKIPASGNNCTATDQRGITRPVGATCDIGAVEFSLALSPPVGSPAGGTMVTITGYGLVAGMTVSLGGSACTGVSVNGAGTSATCTTTVHAMGVVDLTLTANSQSDVFPGLYTYALLNPLPNPQPSSGSGNPLPLPLPPQPTGGTLGSPNPLPPRRP